MLIDATGKVANRVKETSFVAAAALARSYRAVVEAGVPPAVEDSR